MRLDFTPVCGDITISAMASGRALTVRDNTLARPQRWCRRFCMKFVYYESFMSKSLQSDLAFRGKPPPGSTHDLKLLSPSPTPATNSRRAYHKATVTSSSGAVNQDTCSFTPWSTNSPRLVGPTRPPLLTFDCESESLSLALVRLSGLLLCARARSCCVVCSLEPASNGSQLSPVPSGESND